MEVFPSAFGGVVLIGAALLSAGFIDLLSYVAPRCGWMASVNARSSHKNPTPVIGGLAVFLAVALLLFLGAHRSGHGIALDGPIWALSALLLMMGALDDRQALSWRLRLGLQALAIIGGLAWHLQKHTPLAFWHSHLGMLALVFYAFVSLWWLNLFNFMDGLDGFAASEVLFILIGLACSPASFHSGLLGILFFCFLGFLFKNISPAKAFLGDAGSYWIAFILWGWATPFVLEQPASLAWLSMLPAVYVVDASLTLCARIYRGEAFWEGHRRHLYQRLAQRFQSHSKVVLGLWSVNLFLIFPLFLCATRYQEAAFALCMFVYALLSFVFWRWYDA